MESYQEQVAPETHEATTESTGERSISENIEEDEAVDNDLKKHLEEWGEVARERPIRVMVCGLGGVGKSTLVNKLLQLEEGEKWAEEGLQGGATTSVISKHERTTKRGIKVCLFDTPGFDDVNLENEEIIAMMEKETENKLDIIFYCLSLDGAARLQGGDVRAIKLMTQVFSEEIWKKAVVVLTFANALEQKTNICSANDYWAVIRNIAEKMKEALSKDHVNDEIIKNLPILTAGHTEPILRYEADECEKIGGWDNRLFLEALKQVDPSILPQLLKIHFSWKDILAGFGCGGGGAAMGAGVGAAVGAVMGPPGMLEGALIGGGLGAAIGGTSGAGFGVIAYQLVKIKSILRIKYIKWKLDRKPITPRQVAK